MKRIIALILLILLLCGCTAEPQEETTLAPETTVETAPPTEPAGIYVPASALETSTGGAVRYYLPEESDCCGIRMMGSDVLVFSGKETTTLTRCTGEKLYTVAQAQLDCRVDPADTAFQISSNGITYFNPETREVVFLDNDLKEVKRLEMSGDLVGKPVLSANRMQVYYCTADAVRVYDTTTGLDKLLKAIAYQEQSVEAVLLNDSVLCCSLVDERGQMSRIFLSTKTGELLSEGKQTMEVTTDGENFCVMLQEGILQRMLFGSVDQTVQALNPADPFARSWFLEEVNGALTATVTAEYSRLEYYDLTSGLRTASVDLPGGIEPAWAEADPATGDVILMAHDRAADTAVILRWQCSATPTNDETVCAGAYYTQDAPDEAGLAECAVLAHTLGQTHGIRILVGREAVARQPWDYTLVMEYQVPVIRRQLEVLDQVLSQFPEGFFDGLHEGTTICIVRSITGNAASGSLAAAQGVQFWDGEQPFVALAAGDTLAGSFYHEIFHVIDSKILSETRAYYYWHNLNPEGCKYFENYTSYLDADVSQYLEEENRVFIDAYSMCYPKEDRARIMEYACMEGNAHYFQSEVMQSKLKMLCEGIRTAFRLQKYPETLLWEQYLNESLVPGNK